jgi:hypothetical protein
MAEKRKTGLCDATDTKKHNFALGMKPDVIIKFHERYDEHKNNHAANAVGCFKHFEGQRKDCRTS